MQIYKKIILALWTISLLLAVSVKAQKFSLDRLNSTIGFSVKNLKVFTVEGKFKKFAGFIDYHPSKDQFKEVYVNIDVDTIDTENDDRDAHLKSKDFFHVRNEVYDIVSANQFMEFKAKNFTLKEGADFAGSLKILKIQKQVKFKIEKKTIIQDNSGGISKIKIVANGSINRHDFGLTWQKPSDGAKKQDCGKICGR